MIIKKQNALSDSQPSAHGKFVVFLHRCTNFYYGKKAKALRLQLSTCFYYLAPFCVKVKGDDGFFLTTPSLIPFTTQKYV